MDYRGRKALVTGGLGFIGSNLALRLCSLGAQVTVVDSSVVGCGANPRNLARASHHVRIVPVDLREARELRAEIADADVIFNLAGEVSHVHSVLYPERDLELNSLAQLRFLEECTRCAAGVRIVYAGTRQYYGAPEYLPVDEAHPIRPVDTNGIHKFAAAMYHLIWSAQGKLDAVVLNLTNIYGPRMALSAPCQGFLSTFLRRMAQQQRIEVFGSGEQRRDPLFVDDAVEAFLAAGISPELPSRSYNVGGPEAMTIREIAAIASRVAGGLEVRETPFPPDRQIIEIGDYATDWRRIERELGWRPKVPFESGLRAALEFYKEEMTHYLDPGNPDPICKLHQQAAQI